MSIALTTLAAMAMLAGGSQEYAPSGDGPQRVAPRGSFAESCSGSYVNQGRLYADCRDMRGNLRGTSIELAPCAPFDIANSDGLLVCGNIRGSYEGGNNNGGGGRPGGGNGGGWGNGGNNAGGWGGGNNGGGWGNGGNNGGGWGGNNGRSGITVYADRDYRGYSQSFRGEIADLGRSGLNDQISSIELNGGAWEVCTDAYFRGNCQIITSSTRNLNNTGINDRISSMRPARGGGRW
ncbi:beta/gamma crystallin-related protein [Brevundimonas sp. NIBR11]|uniref:beta/gamma crystallin-related protein n=1 Tax=Brevundimonas sp. NIBR11 TaxID=3015999 RepID=UPI0022F1222D|nr:beta/gamma crystallin-related protein [Brevundimonas sp. NIBR11]WGM30873.1 hypothetical protein KKHFBJBL_01107 [Brevundimonas sp. NIBR11]